MSSKKISINFLKIVNKKKIVQFLKNREKYIYCGIKNLIVYGILGFLPVVLTFVIPYDEWREYFLFKKFMMFYVAVVIWSMFEIYVKTMIYYYIHNDIYTFYYLVSENELFTIHAIKKYGLISPVIAIILMDIFWLYSELYERVHFFVSIYPFMLLIWRAGIYITIIFAAIILISGVILHLFRHEIKQRMNSHSHEK